MNDGTAITNPCQLCDGTCKAPFPCGAERYCDGERAFYVAPAINFTTETIYEYEPSNLICPFCGSEGFDKPGLKEHLLGYSLSGDRKCSEFEAVEEL